MDPYTDLTVTFESNGLSISLRVRPTPADFSRLCGDSLSSGIAYPPCPDDLTYLLRDVARQVLPTLGQAHQEVCLQVLSALSDLHKKTIHSMPAQGKRRNPEKRGKA